MPDIRMAAIDRPPRICDIARFNPIKLRSIIGHVLVINSWLAIKYSCGQCSCSA